MSYGSRIARRKIGEASEEQPDGNNNTNLLVDAKGGRRGNVEQQQGGALLDELQSVLGVHAHMVGSLLLGCIHGTVQEWETRPEIFEG